MSDHINAFHKMIDWFKCSVCSEAYLNTSSLKAHLVNTHDVTMTVNEIAKLILKDHTEIKKFRHHKLAWSYTQQNIEDYQNERIIPHSPPKRRYRFMKENGSFETKMGYFCVECDEFFPTNHSYTFHYNESHPDNKTNHLNKHDQNIPIKSSLISSSLTGSRNDNVTVKSCLSEFYDAVSSKYVNKIGPVRYVASGYMAFQCPYCEGQFASKPMCQEHINVKHEKTCSFKCPECDYQTYNRRCLKNHFINLHKIDYSEIRNKNDNNAVAPNNYKAKISLKKKIKNSLFQHRDIAQREKEMTSQYPNNGGSVSNNKAVSVKEMCSEDSILLNQELVKMCYKPAKLKLYKQRKVSIRTKKESSVPKLLFRSKRST